MIGPLGELRAHNIAAGAKLWAESDLESLTFIGAVCGGPMEAKPLAVMDAQVWPAMRAGLFSGLDLLVTLGSLVLCSSEHQTDMPRRVVRRWHGGVLVRFAASSRGRCQTLATCRARVGGWRVVARPADALARLVFDANRHDATFQRGGIRQGEASRQEQRRY